MIVVFEMNVLGTSGQQWQTGKCYLGKVSTYITGEPMTGAWSTVAAGIAGVMVIFPLPLYKRAHCVL